MASLELVNLSKTFGQVKVLHNLDLTVKEGEFLALVGPSGCGKSTLLRIIAGLDDASDGLVVMDGDDVSELSPRERNVAMVFQSYALYPHMTVEENIGFNLRISGLSKAEIASRVEEAAQTLDLTELLKRKPSQLSGGQRQRVAMGRALVRNPDAFLFDEPLSNLDAKLRVQMREEIKRLHKKVRTTSVYVTHDQIEAMTLADRIVIMKDGRIQQIGSPTELYREPNNAFVAGFIGSPAMNFLPGRLLFEGDDRFAVLTDGTRLAVTDERAGEIANNAAIQVGLRPEHLRVAAQGDGDHANRLAGTLDLIEPTGAQNHLKVSVCDQLLTVVDSQLVSLDIDQPVTLSIDPNQVYVFAAA